MNWNWSRVVGVLCCRDMLKVDCSEDLMPSPLAEISTEVCWPDRVTAPDLSLIVTTIRRLARAKTGPFFQYIYLSI